MAMSLTTSTYNRANWEDAEFPILCQVCLGDNPYIRMMKDKFGKECKICQRPFTTFRWCPGRGMRYKNTEVCQTCSKLKNVCQTCLLDLEYGLPVQVRDQALEVKNDLPKSGANRDFYIQNIDREMAISGNTTGPAGALARVTSQQNEVLKKLSRSTPYYRRNLPHICSFWVKGECKRGEECPFRHEKPSDPEDPLSEQNIKDRYYGVNDPVAEKLMKRVDAMPKLSPPEDQNITTLYIGNLGDAGEVSEKDLRDHFYQFGEIRSIHVVDSKGCAFVQFTNRSAAELAAVKSFNKLLISDRKLTVRWGRPHAQTGVLNMDHGAAALQAVPGLPGALPTPQDYLGLKISSEPSHYDAPEPEDNDDDDDEAPGTSGLKRAKMSAASTIVSMFTPSGAIAGAGTPFIPSLFAFPTSNEQKESKSAFEEDSSRKRKSTGSMAPPGAIYYPSMDPHRIGSKDVPD